jgi:cell division protein ZapA
MSENAAAAGGVTPVTIYGRTYRLRGDGDDAYLNELAAMVDGRMREAAGGSGTADTLKVAILTCLNLADECVRARHGSTGSPSRRDDDLEDRMARMVARLEQALGS